MKKVCAFWSLDREDKQTKELYVQMVESDNQ